MSESDLLLQTLQRIESKVDALPTQIAAHGERVAKVEARLDAVEEEVKSDRFWGKLHTFVVSLLAVGGREGIRYWFKV